MLIFRPAVLSVILSCAITASFVSCIQLFEVRQFMVSEVSPGLELCALDMPSDSFSSDSALDCAAQCQQFSYCENFNYDYVNRTCDLFFGRPKCYESSLSCVHYQIQVDEPNVGIPGENCSLPFTYAGHLYSGCDMSLTADGCSACLVRNRTLTLCLGSYVTFFVAVNMTIPNFAMDTPLMSISSWLVIQQRVDGSLAFNKSWTVYKNGFGDINKNYWLGLEKMHQLTINAPYRLRVEIQSMAEGKWFSAEYDAFFITSEELGYALNVSGYVGDAGDVFNNMNDSGVFCQNGMKFSTFERDNTPTKSKCATAYPGGFWHNACCYICLNCIYGSSAGFTCYTMFKLGLSESPVLKTSRMMIKHV